MTGSGVLFRQLFREAQRAGDRPFALFSDYEPAGFADVFGADHAVVLCGEGQPGADYDGLIPGMSDTMPYRTAVYGELSSEEIGRYVAAFRRKVEAIVEAYAPDVLHIHHLWAQLGLLETVPLPAVVTVHGTDLRQARFHPRLEGLVEPYLGRVGRYTAVSGDARRETLETWTIDAERIEVVGNGFDPEVFHPTPGSGESEGPALVVAVGKYVDWKGFEYLIRAMAELRDRRAKLVILGTGSPERKQELLDVARRAEVTDRLDLPGHVPAEEVASTLRRARVYVLPSTEEAFGLVVLEALACGCRVVTSATAGPKDLIEDELIEDGLARLVPPPELGDAEDGARYVRQLAEAVDAQLEASTSDTQRARVAASVADRTWQAVYQQVRGAYRLVQP